MKFVEPSPFNDPNAAARKLMEIANSVEPVQDGRIKAHFSALAPLISAPDPQVRRPR